MAAKNRANGSPELDAAGQQPRLCPKCGHGRISRSHRQGLLDRCMSLVGLRPYFCEDCERRFYRRRRRPPRLPLRWARCPRCLSTEIARIESASVPHRWSNLPWRWFRLPAYRCPECRKRFFDVRPKDPAEAKSEPRP